MAPVVVLGTSGHAAVVVELARAAGLDVVGCIGPDHADSDAAFAPYLGGDDWLDSEAAKGVALANGIGSVGVAGRRKPLFLELKARGFDFPALVHPRAVVAPTARIGAGALVMAGAIVQAFAEIGDNVIVNSGAIVEHHCRIGEHAHVAPGATLCGGVVLGAESFVGAGATVIQYRTIGARAMIAAGAVVVGDVDDGAELRGVPAK
ncbi:MAG TPA: acetyltransferase [Hyphomicrobiales bacterium]|nr:acetyltransferase [Kaistiaceae bacterium]HQF29817.1 acetyltransferase [Hyphomicrobiales bacterium]